MLEKTERDQAEALCPSTTSSRKNSTHTNTPKSLRQVSAAKPALPSRSYTAPYKLTIPLTSSSERTDTPTRGPKLNIATAEHSRVLSLRTPIESPSEIDYFSQEHAHKSSSDENSGFTPVTPKEPPFALNSNSNKIYRIPSSPTIVKRSSRSKPQRGELYFFEHERQKIEQLVAQSKNRNCTDHQNCTDCIEKEYAYYENKVMSTSMPPERRQQIMKANRSIRNIKTVR